MADLATLTARRDAIDAAIDRTLLAQEYQQGRNRKQNPLLKTLLDQRDKLDMQIASYGPMCSVGQPVRPR